MTTPIPSPRTPLGGALSSPRTLAAWVLVGYVALFLFFEFVELVLPGGASFSGRAAGADFRSLFVMAMPVLAVLLASYVSPPVPGARLLTVVALLEYCVALTFGLLTLLIGAPSVLDGINNAQSGFGAMRYFVMGLMELVLIAIAAYVTVRALSGAKRNRLASDSL
jgi:hypothetical protein